MKSMKNMKKEPIAKLCGNVAQSPSAVLNLLNFQCFLHNLPSRGRLGYIFAIGSKEFGKNTAGFILSGFVVCVLVLVLGGCEREKTPTPSVRINGHSWQVELAMTAQARRLGLSGRGNLPASRGMLFVYPRAKNLAYCMRGCEIPIDIVFIGPDGLVVNVYAMQVEPDRAGRVRYESHIPACYALELAGGQAKLAGIAVGNRVEFIDIPPRHQAQRGE